MAMDPRNGEVLALGSQPELRPQRVRQAALAGAATTRSTPRPTARRWSTARSPRPYPTGSTFKPITAMAALAGGPDHAQPRRSSTRRVQARRHHVQERRRRRLRRAARCRARSQVSSDVFFYRLGARANARGGRSIQKWARKLGLGPPTASTCPASSRAWCPTAAGATPATTSTASAQEAARAARRARSSAAHRAPVVAATTSTSRSARATCRRPRCRWRSPTRRSPTAARSCAPHLGHARRGRRRARAPGDPHPRAARKSTSRPSYRAGDHRRPARRRQRARRHVGRRLQGLPDHPVDGKTGTAERGAQPDQSWYVVLRAASRRRPIVVVVTDRAAAASAPRRRRPRRA